MKYRVVLYVSLLLSVMLLLNCSKQEHSHAVMFNENASEYTWALSELNPELPSDWSSYKYLVLEMKASSPQRFKFGFTTENGLITKIIHPFAGVWIRFVVPLDFYHRENTKGSEMAATWNQSQAVGWMNIWAESDL